MRKQHLKLTATHIGTVFTVLSVLTVNIETQLMMQRWIGVSVTSSAREKGNQYKLEILLIYYRRVTTKDDRAYESSRFVKIWMSS